MTTTGWGVHGICVRIICPDPATPPYTTVTTVDNVAFVVISGGGNFNTQTDIDTIGVFVNVYDVGIPNVDDYEVNP
ncbi:hypothetical protein M1N69_00190 [Thermodesulfovibrionales bacterium]|nr:hypothetical protein [Thermodesulfovibrionales bacterium]